MRFQPLFLTSLMTVLLATSAAAGGSTWYVDASQPGLGSGTLEDPYASIAYALSLPTTVSGDTVSVAPGVYTGNIDYNGKDVWIESQRGALETHILPSNMTQPTVTGGGGWTARLVGFTVRGNTNRPGIHTAWGQGCHVERCIVRDNHQGLENNYDMWLKNCNVVENTFGVGHFGGGHGADSITTINDTIFWENGTDFYGWGLDCHGGWLCVSDSTFVDPLFHDTEDYQIQSGSPCVNTGAASGTDPDGSRLDIGVFPYDPNYPLGRSFCTPTANTSGGRAVIAVSGSASLSANDLVFSVTRTPANSSGLFFFGTDQAYYPLGDGFVCLGGAIGRLPLTPTGPTGIPVYAMDNTADLPPHVPAILPGEGRGIQYWFRDPAGGPSGWNYSNAVWVVFTP